MNEFFHSTLFFLLLAQSSAFVCDRYIDSLMNKKGRETIPYFYHTIIYDIHEIITGLVFIISIIFCCIKYSWWLIVILPASLLVASPVLASFIAISILRLLGWNITRFLAVIVTALINTAIILMSFID